MSTINTANTQRARAVLKECHRAWGIGWGKLGPRQQEAEVCRELVRYVLLSQGDEQQPLLHTANVAREALQLLEREQDGLP